LHHIALFEEFWQNQKHFALLKKFAKTYINNFRGASELRDLLMETKTLSSLRTILENKLRTSNE
jgi:tRNA-dihydrouridine synthase